jgi:hypothetical protein
MRTIVCGILLIGSFACLAQPAAPGNLGYSPYAGPPLATEGRQVPGSVLEYYHALGWLRTYAAKLEASCGSRLPETRAPLRQIQQDAQFLQQKWMDWPRLHQKQSPYSGEVKRDPYFRAIQRAYQELKDLPKQPDAVIREQVDALAADVHAKAENCRFSTDGLGKEITVTVCTKRGTKDVPGYVVWCVPLALVKFKDEHIRFPKLSSPTVMKGLAPGCYAIWLEQDQHAFPAVTQTIGGHGEKQLEIDLPVQADEPAPSSNKPKD